MDWVPAHFPSDEHGLGMFDGTALYEHGDPRQGLHKDWNTLIFNYGRNEVANYLISNALYWIQEFHLDGLRVDAVASMLYLDYSRDDGEWIPNEFGGNHNLAAITFLKRMNEAVHLAGGITFAEESTSFPKVSHPTYEDGLGFTFKWNMGWMHDTLEYFGRDPAHRSFHQENLTFGLLYAFSENFQLPFSHDEVVHGKGSLIDRMPGDDWQKRANLRALLALMFAYPGKKLLFMGCEIGQYRMRIHCTNNNPPCIQVIVAKKVLTGLIAPMHNTALLRFNAAQALITIAWLLCVISRQLFVKATELVCRDQAHGQNFSTQTPQTTTAVALGTAALSKPLANLITDNPTVLI